MPAALHSASLHHAILLAIVDRGCAPTAEELAGTFGVPRDAVSAGLRATTAEAGMLFARHGLTGPIWTLPDATVRF